MAFEPSVGNFEAHSCGQPQLLCPLARSAIFGSNSNVFQQQQCVGSEIDRLNQQVKFTLPILDTLQKLNSLLESGYSH
jgi:hypothetical protein